MWYSVIFRKPVKKIQVPWKYNNNNVYFVWILMYIYVNLAHFFLKWEIFQTNRAEKFEIHAVCSFHIFFSKFLPFLRKCRKILQCRAGHRQQYSTCLLHAVYLRPQTFSQNTFYLLNFHFIKGCTKAPLCYMIRTLAVFLSLSNNVFPNGANWIVKWNSCKFFALRNLSSIFSAWAWFLYCWVKVLFFVTGWWRKLTMTYWYSLLLHSRLNLFMIGDNV